MRCKTPRAWLLTAALVAACSDDGDYDDGTRYGTEKDPVTAPDASEPLATSFTRVKEIVETSCAPCHTMNGAAMLTLGTNGGLDQLLNVPAKGGPCAPTGRLRVVPGDASASLIIRKLEGGPDLCGERMPRGREPLPQAQIDEIRSWINAGARDN